MRQRMDLAVVFGGAAQVRQASEARRGGLSWPASSAASPNRMAAAILSSSSRARTATVATRAFGRFVASNAAAMPAASAASPWRA